MKTLLYTGCVYKYKLKNLLDNYLRLLKKLNVDYVILEELTCCGIPLRNGGYKKEFDLIANKNVAIINESEIDEIIVLCPECNRMLEKQYKKGAGLKDEIKVTFIVNYILERTTSVSVHNDNVTYQDSCYAGRRSGFFEQPRELLQKMGYTILEVEDNRELSHCCGGGGNVRENNRELSDAVAQTRVNQFKITGARSIVTNCPHCYVCLSGKGMDVKDMGELCG
jgi:heterodisulfide reductase subunit D